ncbi:MAG: type II toxin-antitoxin system VapC family toxin [Deltaproteobacteria bacterium]|nr:type II toxin-antitoxin system VapC family toxin [Deltaproteobacteria bacterium]
MILPDINLLVYAHNEAAPQHALAREWWEELHGRSQPIALPWAVALGFVRLVTHPRILVEPLTPAQALDRVDSWLGCDHVQVIDPGERHLAIVRRLFEATGVGGALTTDTHLAALAIEHQCELHSNDCDFSRFPGLRWRNPLA